MNVNNALTMHDPELKLPICVKNIDAEGTMSQNFNIGRGSFSVKFRKNIQRKITKRYPFLPKNRKMMHKAKNLRHSPLNMDVIHKH